MKKEDSGAPSFRPQLAEGGVVDFDFAFALVLVLAGAPSFRPQLAEGGVVDFDFAFAVVLNL